MVSIVQKQNYNSKYANSVSFGENKELEEAEHAKDRVLAQEMKKKPISTSLKIQSDKFIKAFTMYPKKGLEGSKNANFYEFLTMGMVPYLTGSAAMIGVFNLANKFFDTPGAVNASKLGKKMGIGVILYGLGKVLSKKLIEKPLKWKYGIDVNLPVDRVINELPEERNKNKLVVHEFHKVFESVDFPRYDLLYDNKFYGENRNAYFDKVAKKMGMDKTEYSDQQTKDVIKEKVVKTKLFTTLSSYLWAATGVAIAAQKPWENLVLNPKVRMNNLTSYLNSVKSSAIKDKLSAAMKYDSFIKDAGKKFVKSLKELVNNGSKTSKYAGRALLGCAIGMTLLGNFKTLFDFNNNRGKHGASPIIDENKEKVVC